MITLNRISYSKLKPFEVHFRQAVYGCSYSGITTQKVTAIYDIVRKVGYQKKVNSACNACRLKFLQEVGQAYFNFQEQLKNDMREVRAKRNDED